MNTHLRDNLNSLRSEHFGVQRFRGLHLRTHPDANVAAAQVWMTADEVVMDDGTRLAFTTPIAANIAAAGVGGLDTGAEAASTWYEVYAIAKDDGTKNLLLHRAKDYFLDVSQPTDDNVYNLRLAASNGNQKIAQSFQPVTAGQMPFVDVKLIRSGAVSGRVWFTIEADAAGAPSGTPLATSDKLDASVISTSAQVVRFIFRTPSSLSASTTYWLVFQGDYTISDTVVIGWRVQIASPPYAGGTAANYNGTVWANQAADMWFKVYITRNDTAVTLPTGYTKQAKVGYVYNDSGSDLDQFVARDRYVRLHHVNGETGTVTATVPTLTDLAAIIPPGLITPDYIFSGDADLRVVNAASVPDGFGATTTNLTHGNVFAFTQGAGGVGVESIYGGRHATEYQAAYVFVAAGSGRAQVMGWEW